MMKFSVITLFPEFYNEFVQHSIIKRAINKKAVKIELVNLRQFGLGAHKQVDDYQFGGGQGMVLKVDVVVSAIESVKQANSLVVLLSPQAQVWGQTQVQCMSKHNHIILVCGHYEGFDERIRNFVDMHVSVGDYILTGGEIPSLIVMDSIIRILPTVINPSSHTEESFSTNLLDYAVYTKPLVFRRDKVPDVLLSGHHANINAWRQNNALVKTKTYRPDLLKSKQKK